MKNYLYLILLILSVSSCRKEEDCIDRKSELYTLKPELLATMAYQHGQTVTLKKAGETFSFTVDIALDTVEYSRFFCEECCTDTIFDYEETLSVVLFDSIHDFSFQFYSNGTYGHAMFISVIPFLNQYNGAGTVHYYMDSGTYLCDGNFVVCHDTITIGTTLYQDVIEITQNHGSIVPYAVNNLFYSTAKGILRVIFHNEDDFLIVE